MNKIISLDEQLLLWINSFHTQSMDVFMWMISAKSTWVSMYIALVVVLVYKYRSQHKVLLFCICALGLSVGCSDIIASQIIKNTVCRLRPTHNESLALLVHTVNGYQGGLYGFVSNHASDTMTFALLSSLILRNRIIAVILTLWVAINCYSRMYLGVHYPLDIVGGLLLGSIVALLTYWVLLYVIAHWVGHNGDVWNCRYGENR